MGGPPQGWYEDVDRPGYDRWWDGGVWTEHRQPSTKVEAAPPHPAPTAAVAAVKGAGSTLGTNQCPVCHQSDAIQKMSVVLDSGVSATSGSAATVTARGNVAVTTYGSATSTALASRIAPPPRPAFNFRGTFILAWVGVCVVIGIIYAASSGAGFVGFIIAGLFSAFLAWIPALVIAIIAKSVTSASYRDQGAMWDRQVTTYRAAYYCSRDDVIFSPSFSGSPAAFRASAFAAPAPTPTVGRD